MTHFICRGANCTSVSERPSVCMNASCSHRYKLLEECTCPHRTRHIAQVNVSNTNITSGQGIDVVNFGLALGIALGVGIFIMGIISMFGIGEGAVQAFSTIYIGYDSTLIGAVAGSLWGLVDGFIGGVLIAWLYNQLSRVR